MSTKPSAAAMKAQAQMFGLLTSHFDPDAGAFVDGWDDKRIATDTGLAPDVVAEFRRAGFGEIKEPDEVRKLREDIASLDKLERERAAAMQQEIATLRSKLAKVSARWAA